MSTTTVYISIGNSDNKLTQVEWAQFAEDVHTVLVTTAHRLHGNWASDSLSPWQNACWCVEFLAPEMVEKAWSGLAQMARRYRQDSIAWAVAPKTEFIAPLANGD